MDLSERQFLLNMANLDEVSKEVLLQIHNRVEPGRPARALRNLGQDSVGKDDAGHQLVRVHYGNYCAGMCNGEYECVAAIDSEGGLVEVRSSRNLWS